jgi:hypothetical protein
MEISLMSLAGGLPAGPPERISFGSVKVGLS